MTISLVISVRVMGILIEASKRFNALASIANGGDGTLCSSAKRENVTL